MSALRSTRGHLIYVHEILIDNVAGAQSHLYCLQAIFVVAASSTFVVDCTRFTWPLMEWIAHVRKKNSKKDARERQKMANRNMKSFLSFILHVRSVPLLLWWRSCSLCHFLLLEFNIFCSMSRRRRGLRSSRQYEIKASIIMFSMVDSNEISKRIRRIGLRRHLVYTHECERKKKLIVYSKKVSAIAFVLPAKCDVTWYDDNAKHFLFSEHGRMCRRILLCVCSDCSDEIHSQKKSQITARIPRPLRPLHSGFIWVWHWWKRTHPHDFAPLFWTNRCKRWTHTTQRRHHRQWQKKRMSATNKKLPLIFDKYENDKW